MHDLRTCHTTSLLQNGKILALGGFQADGVYLKSSELYDPLTETWTVSGNMIFKRVCHKSLTLNDGQVLVTGGYGGEGQGRYLSITELYNPLTDTWTITGSM